MTENELRIIQIAAEWRKQNFFNNLRDDHYLFCMGQYRFWEGVEANGGRLPYVPEDLTDEELEGWEYERREYEFYFGEG